MQDVTKTNHQFRDYSNIVSKVKKTYQQMQENQNLLFVKVMKKKYAGKSGYTDLKGKKIRKSFIDIFTILDKIVDESDPDTQLPQIYHAFQTAEALKEYCDSENLSKIKENILIKNLFSPIEWDQLSFFYQQKFNAYIQELYPHIKDWSWLPLIGFLHDIGKVLVAPEWGALPQWAVVGDTFPLGVEFSPANIYYEEKFYLNNDDINGTANLINYEKNCGFEKLTMTWGHDEYCYWVLQRTQHHLPAEALYIIRFHSFYPWHSPRNGNRGYEEFADQKDWMMLPLLKLFQKSDLYSKQVEVPDVASLTSYYLNLIERFISNRSSSSKQSDKILW